MDAIEQSFGTRRQVRTWQLTLALIVVCLQPTPEHASAADAASTTNCAIDPVALVEFSRPGSPNRCPLADAGQDSPIFIDGKTALDASATSDPDGQPLRFTWSLVYAPAGSTAQPVDPNSVTTHFVPDLAGDYVFQLTVIDSDGGSSIDVVRYSTDNTAPTAIAGPDISATLGEAVTLYAERSYDPDGTALSYHWRVAGSPVASRSELSGYEESSETLILDVDGDYVVELVVGDGVYESAADTLRISTFNSVPVAHAGEPRELAPNSTLILDDAQSHDVDGDSLVYHWSLLSSPQASQLELADSNAVAPRVRVDAEGLYLFQLVVDDGIYESEPATVLILVQRQGVQELSVDDSLSLASTSASAGDDTDGDGVFDPLDNCVLIANVAQRDTDGDGLGNFCDADLNDDGIVDSLDLGILTTRFFSAGPDADFNGDGIVDFLDLGLMTARFLQPPGPSGTVSWISLVDGDWNDRLNWAPRIVPTAPVDVVIDVSTAVTVTLNGGSTTVKNLVLNEDLLLVDATFEALGVIELGGTIVASATTINDTSFVPSLAGSGTLTVNSGVHNWSGVTVGVDAVLNNGAIVNASDGLTVDATTTIDAPSSPTGFHFVNDQTLGGSGTIVLDGAGNSVVSEPRLLPFTGTTLTVASSVTIRGGNGTVGQLFASLVFLGDLTADVASEELVIGGMSWSTSGTIRAINNGEVRFFGNMENGGDTLSLDTAGGSISLTANAALANAIFSGTTGTNLIVLPGTTTLTGMTFNHDLTHQNGAISNVAGGLTINGTSTIVAPTAPTGYHFVESQSLLGNGTIVFDSAGNSVVSEPRLLPANFTTLTIGPSISIRGTQGTVGQSSATLVMNGSIDADVSSQMILVGGIDWSGTGTLTASNGGVLQPFGSLDNAGQTLNFDSVGGSLVITSGTVLRNTTLAGATGGSLNFEAGTYTFDNLTINGDMTLANGAIANVTNGLTLNGTAFINAPTAPTGMHFTNTQTLGGSATIIINGIGNSVISEPRLLPATFTTLTIASNVTVRGGQGTIGSSFASLIVDGTISADLGPLSVSGNSVTNNGLLEAVNAQSITVSNANNSQGSLHSGAGSTIVLSSALFLSAMSNVFIDITNSASVGRIDVTSGAANYAGTLTISAVDGFMPNLGDSFDILSYNGFSGSFGTVNSVGLGGGQSFGLTLTPFLGTATVN